MKNELINGTKMREEVTITTREVAEMLGMQHYKVLEKLEGTKDGKTKGIIPILTAHDFVVSDYFIESSYKDGSGKENREYLCTKLGCDFLANKFTGEKGILFTAKYVKRFRDMEDALSNQASRMIPTSYKEALIQLLDQVEKNEMLLEENKVLTPKAKYTDDVLKKEDAMPITIAANDLGITAQRLNSILWVNGVQYKVGKSWVLTKEYQWMIEEGYADFTSYTTEHARPQLQWTELGRKWIVDKYDDLVEFYNEHRDDSKYSKKKSA